MTVQSAPEFTLSQHDIVDHDEVDIYGLDHTLVYESDLELYERAVVMMRVGGKLVDVDSNLHTIRFQAWTMYPFRKDEESRVDGKLMLSTEFENNELEVIGGAIVRILANRNKSNGEEE